MTEDIGLVLLHYNYSLSTMCGVGFVSCVYIGLGLLLELRLGRVGFISVVFLVCLVGHDWLLVAV